MDQMTWYVGPIFVNWKLHRVFEPNYEPSSIIWSTKGFAGEDCSINIHVGVLGWHDISSDTLPCP